MDEVRSAQRHGARICCNMRVSLGVFSRCSRYILGTHMETNQSRTGSPKELLMLFDRHFPKHPGKPRTFAGSPSGAKHNDRTVEVKTLVCGGNWDLLSLTSAGKAGFLLPTTTTAKCLLLLGGSPNFQTRTPQKTVSLNHITSPAKPVKRRGPLLCCASGRPLWPWLPCGP